MLYAALKVLLTAVLVVAISEAAKRSTLLGGILASLPADVATGLYLGLRRDRRYGQDRESLRSVSSGMCCLRSCYLWLCRFF